MRAVAPAIYAKPFPLQFEVALLKLQYILVGFFYAIIAQTGMNVRCVSRLKYLPIMICYIFPRGLDITVVILSTVIMLLSDLVMVQYSSNWM